MFFSRNTTNAQKAESEKQHGCGLWNYMIRIEKKIETKTIRRIIL